MMYMRNFNSSRSSTENTEDTLNAPSENLGILIGEEPSSERKLEKFEAKPSALNDDAVIPAPSAPSDTIESSKTDAKTDAEDDDGRLSPPLREKNENEASAKTISQIGEKLEATTEISFDDAANPRNNAIFTQEKESNGCTFNEEKNAPSHGRFSPETMLLGALLLFLINEHASDDILLILGFLLLS